MVGLRKREEPGDDLVQIHHLGITAGTGPLPHLWYLSARTLLKRHKNWPILTSAEALSGLSSKELQ
jgi:hypothetical protein